jgi:hypothetical protein
VVAMDKDRILSKISEEELKRRKNTWDIEHKKWYGELLLIAAS